MGCPEKTIRRYAGLNRAGARNEGIIGAHERCLAGYLEELNIEGCVQLPSGLLIKKRGKLATPELLMSIINPHPHLVNISFLECLVDDVGYLPDNIDFLLDVEFLQPSEFDIATADYLLGAQMHVSKKTVRDVKDIIPGIIQNRYNSGDFDVCLVVLSPEGCYDTACATIRNYFDVSINVPNVFTPDADGFNDEFVVEAENWTKYEIKIFNRFSEKVFQSTDPADSWNGKKNNTGADLPAGVYYVVITYQLRGESEKTYKGTVSLIRK